MATKESKKYTIISKEETPGRNTFGYARYITPDRVVELYGNLIPKYARLTNVTIAVEWKTSLSSAAEYRLYINNQKVGNTCQARNKYFHNEHSNLQGYFLSESEHPVKPIGDIKIDFSATVMRKYYVRLWEIIYEYIVPNFTVTVSVGSGEGTVSGAGTYDVGTSVTVKATPNSGYRFVKWSDGNTSATRTVTIANGSQKAFSTPLSYTAIFEAVTVPPELTSVAMTYGGNQISQTNKVPAGEGYLISVGIK